MNSDLTPQTMKVSNPDRIQRVLERVAAGGLSIQVRALKQPETAVKGRAVASGSLELRKSFSIGGISEKGRAHLMNLGEGGLQVEFVLMSTKIVFYSKIVEFDGNGVLVSIPDYLLSIERRKNSRFPVTVSTRAYMQLENWHADYRDPAVNPFFEYQRDFASLLHIGDLSVGGVSIISRFPAACRVLQKGSIIENANLMLPLSAPIPMMVEVRWVKRVKEGLQDFAGAQRMSRAYKFGIQFVNPSEKLSIELQKFMAKLAVAEAI